MHAAADAVGGGDLLTVVCDVTQPEEYERAVAQSNSALGARLLGVAVGEQLGRTLQSVAERQVTGMVFHLPPAMAHCATTLTARPCQRLSC